MIELERVSCDCCGGASSRELYSMPDLRFGDYSQTYNVVECGSCGHRFLNPRPKESELGRLYPQSYYDNRKAEEPGQKGRYERQLSLLPPLSGGSLLDLGCAGGAWLEMARGKGWDVMGVDFVRSEYVSASVPIKIGGLPDIDFAGAQFDIVTAWGVMEHIPSPSLYFKKVHSILKGGGSFIFMVPNAESLWSRYAYKEDVPRHLQFYRPSSLRRYASESGFAVEKVIGANFIYSKPATGRGLFRRRALLWMGVPWEEINMKPKGAARRFGAMAASLLDMTLIHPSIEGLLGLAGNMVAFFKKS